jgi:hypothetical protein
MDGRYSNMPVRIEIKKEMLVSEYTLRNNLLDIPYFLIQMYLETGDGEYLTYFGKRVKVTEEEVPIVSDHWRQNVPFWSKWSLRDLMKVSVGVNVRPALIRITPRIVKSVSEEIIQRIKSNVSIPMEWRSLLLRRIGLSHPLHDSLIQYHSIGEDGDEGQLFSSEEESFLSSFPEARVPDIEYVGNNEVRVDVEYFARDQEDWTMFSSRVQLCFALSNAEAMPEISETFVTGVEYEGDQRTFLEKNVNNLAELKKEQHLWRQYSLWIVSYPSRYWSQFCVAFSSHRVYCLPEIWLKNLNGDRNIADVRKGLQYVDQNIGSVQHFEYNYRIDAVSLGEPRSCDAGYFPSVEVDHRAASLSMAEETYLRVQDEYMKVRRQKKQFGLYSLPMTCVYDLDTVQLCLRIACVEDVAKIIFSMVCRLHFQSSSEEIREWGVQDSLWNLGYPLPETDPVVTAIGNRPLCMGVFKGSRFFSQVRVPFGDPLFFYCRERDKGIVGWVSQGIPEDPRGTHLCKRVIGSYQDKCSVPGCSGVPWNNYTVFLFESMYMERSRKNCLFWFSVMGEGFEYHVPFFFVAKKKLRGRSYRSRFGALEWNGNHRAFIGRNGQVVKI